MLHNSWTESLRFAVILTGLTLAQAGSAQAIVETLPDGPYEELVETERNVVVLLHHPQAGLMGPDALEIQRDQPRNTHRDTWGREAIWRLIGQTHEGRRRITATSTDLTAREAFENLVTRFDFVDTTLDSIARFDTGSNWSIQGINRTELDFKGDREWNNDSLVRKVFYRSDADGVMTLRYTYFMSPDLRHIRLVAEVRMYRRAPRSVRKYTTTLMRRYEYLSPAHESGLRPWHRGEKEAFERTIERDYSNRVEMYPHNKSAYKKDRDDLRRELRRNPDRILLPDGMLEAWSPEDLHAALALAAEHMSTMIRADLAQLPADELVDGRMLTVTARQLDGDPKRIRAREFFRDGENTVYQTGGGNLYSIPTAK